MSIPLNESDTNTIENTISSSHCYFSCGCNFSISWVTGDESILIGRTSDTSVKCKEGPANAIFAKKLNVVQSWGCVSVQIQGVFSENMSVNIPVVSDTAWAVGGAHRRDYGNNDVTHFCVFNQWWTLRDTTHIGLLQLHSQMLRPWVFDSTEINACGK